MGDAVAETPRIADEPHATAEVICREFLKVLARMEVEQPMICRNVCACAQLWRYQHYYLPLWLWGVTKLVCLNLGSLRHVRANGGPFDSPKEEEETQEPDYRTILRTPCLRATFNALPLSLTDPLQSLLRHAAALDVALSLTICGARGGVEHERVKTHFKRLCAIISEGGAGGDGDGEKKLGKLGKKPKMAAGEWVEVWFVGGYDAEEREGLRRAGEVLGREGAGVLRVAEEVELDEKTMVYAVGGVEGVFEAGVRPAAVMCQVEQGSHEARILRDEYEEYKLDGRMAPHTIGPAHLYIRNDVVRLAERDRIVPPYPVTFPHDYPHEHKNWYLDKLPRNGSGKVVKREHPTRE